MTIFKVAYDPPFSDEVRNALSSYPPSMVAPEDYGAQFTIEVAESVVRECGRGEDLDLIDDLKAQDVDYVEIT
jgi:hypothetical protein